MSSHTIKKNILANPELELTKIPGTIFCKLCGSKFKGTKKDHIDRHCDTKKHRKLIEEKSTIKPIQFTRNLSNRIIAEGFLKSGIPLNKLEDANKNIDQ